MENEANDRGVEELVTATVREMREQMGNKHTILAYFNAAALVPLIFYCGLTYNQLTETRERVKGLEALLAERTATITTTTLATTTIAVELNGLKEEVRRLRERLENPVANRRNQ